MVLSPASLFKKCLNLTNLVALLPPMKNLLLITAFFLILSLAGAYGQEIAGYDVLWGIKVPMRDGINLGATVYKPDAQRVPLPVILDITPYIGDTYHARAKYFSQNGYVYALIDCRGRGSSDGIFDPFMQEAKDGYDLVEWFAKQPYSNGKITMWGGSYSGYNQWATAKEFPPHLATIVPVAAAHPGIDYPAPSNIFQPYFISHLTYISGKTGNGNLFNENAYWQTKYAEMYRDHRPFNELDQIVGNETTMFQTWLLHPTYDAYWKSMNPTANDFRKMTLPVLTITGHYDGDQLGNMTHYKNFMTYASPIARAKMYLIIGPYDHAGTRTPQREVGGIRFGLASLLNMNKLHKEWYDFTMKGGTKPDFLKKQVAYYVMGAEKWKYADHIEDIAGEFRKYYLASGGSAHEVFQSGTLSTTVSEKSETDQIKYDPLNTRTGLDARSQEADLAPMKNQFDAMNLGEEGVIYHSTPFQDTTEVTGVIKLKIYLSADVPDVDLSASLYEITPSGESIFLTSDVMRLRYRESLEYEKLMKPNEVYECNFNTFNFFSRQIQKQSRLRIVVAAINSIVWEKNYCSGGVVAAETAKDARNATITIYHNKKYPSYLEIPVSK